MEFSARITDSKIVSNEYIFLTMLVQFVHICTQTYTTCLKSGDCRTWYWTGICGWSVLSNVGTIVHWTSTSRGERYTDWLTTATIHHAHWCIWCTSNISNTSIEKWTCNFGSTNSFICWSLITIAWSRFRTIRIRRAKRSRTFWWILNWLT